MKEEEKVVIHTSYGQDLEFDVVLYFNFEGQEYCLLGTQAFGDDVNYLIVRHQYEYNAEWDSYPVIPEDALIPRDSYPMITDDDELTRVQEYFSANQEELMASELYSRLESDEFRKYPYQAESLGEGMSVINKSIYGWWKPLFLVNHNSRRAYVFMDENQISAVVTEDDIDWDSLKGLPEKALDCARMCSFHFPSFIRQFRNGVALVSWQLNPDGMYYCDEDGFGMTDDQEIEIYGFIDSDAKVVVKFRNARTDAERAEMRREAEKIVRDRIGLKTSL